MKKISLVLVFLFVSLQYKLWLGQGNVFAVSQLKQQVQGQRNINDRWQQNNAVLISNIKDLKGNEQAIEERARLELGMIKKGEKFYQVVD